MSTDIVKATVPLNSDPNFVLRKKLTAELQFMKDLFEKLPTGESTEHIEAYFNQLQEIIDTKDGSDIRDKLKFDVFEEDVEGRNYKYLSPAYLEQRASQRNAITYEQSMDPPPSPEIGGCVSTQIDSQESSDTACLSESA